MSDRTIGHTTMAWAPVTSINDVRPTAFAALTQAERTRLESMSDARADEFLLGRYLLRALAVDLGAAQHPNQVIITAVCSTCGGQHGRPEIEGFRASITHATGMAVVALAPVDAVAALGIDTESTDALENADALVRWVSGEAVLKADGRGLRGDVPLELDVTAQGGSAVVKDSGKRYELTSIQIPGRVTFLAVEIA